MSSQEPKPFTIATSNSSFSIQYKCDSDSSKGDLEEPKSERIKSKLQIRAFSEDSASHNNITKPDVMLDLDKTPESFGLILRRTVAK